ncbi:uncharacterized protein LOC120677663 [Panicum virgatum]|uniref:Uncharacterized protein n=1 Tax=Panicum virgatum TaxID=38727 RepID=A0A8T0WCE9_PANVG|nr:uncharacterized protein LOC120677663 [Panicum virgatum]XP_039814779.1 uncharacterized protein LOC120677663 [Panicum virgatum]KAG2643044.1 hypothetical protein PVAP13_2KG324300 [Panicum virgatum]
MAAAEARAAWQRAANSCLVQEDAKRAPKLACCPQSVQQHDTSNPTSPQDPHIPNFMPINWNLMSSNLPTDTQWWLQLQPNYGCQMALAREHLNYINGEAGEKIMEGSVPLSKPEDVGAKRAADPFEPPWIVSTNFMKQSSETGLEELKTLAGYSPTSLKCKGNANNCIYEDKEFTEFKAFDPLFPKKPQNEYCGMNAPWDDNKKSQPWWQVADGDGLASLVAERAMENIVNNDLPRSAKAVMLHGAELNSPGNKVDYELPLPSGKELNHVHDTMACSYSVSSTTMETNSSDGGGWEQRWRNNVPGGAQDSYSSTNSTPDSKPTYQNATERAKLLDALRHSQTRAREAEIAAKKAYDEKEHVIKLLIRQASHLFACKQWLKMLQLENICLQLRFKDHQIAAMFPELPWMMVKEKVAPGQEHKDGTRKRGRRPNRRGGLRNTVAFAVGVGIVGAGLLLGWTLGWLLPKL